MENSQNTQSACGQNFWQKLGPVDIISVIIIIGAIILKLNGGDGVVTALLSSIVFYYYGKQGALNK